MRIANPLYDIVFKYLMEDNALAKLVLSTILGEEITTLTFRPQEQTTLLTTHSLTVFRLDFTATIKTANQQYRQVLIELQKAQLGTDIMRFRRYLGEQYRNPDNLIPTTEQSSPSLRKKALPILSIYILGYPLDYSTAPVIYVQRHCIDLATGENLKQKEPFIESLSHDSYIIQIPHLPPKGRTEVEKLLQIFNQQQVCPDRHFLEIEEQAFSSRYQPLVRRLQRAIAEPEVVAAMDVEDEILSELQNLERAVAQEREEKEQAVAKAAQAQAEAIQAQAEATQAQAEATQAQTEKEQAYAEASKERAEKERLLALLRQAGIAP